MARGMVRKDPENATCEMFLGYRDILRARRTATVRKAPWPISYDGLGGSARNWAGETR